MYRSPLLMALAAMAWLLALPAAIAAPWEQIAPPGGRVVSVAIGGVNGHVYAVATTQPDGGARAYRTVDNGASWQVGDVPTGCQAAGYVALDVRSDGQVIAQCGDRFFASRDEMRTWRRFSPPDLTGIMVFDPVNPQRAVFRSYTNLLYATVDDGATWIPRLDPDVVPYSLAFDPGKPGRLVGLTAPYPPTYTYEYVHESLDYGATWRFVSTIFVSPPYCVTGTLSSDPAGTLYRFSSCGILRSDDGGVVWQAKGMPPGDPYFLYPMAVDPTRRGYLLVRTTAGLWESFDSADSWASLPGPPGTLVYAADVAGAIWIATDLGVQAYDRAQRSWSNRSNGIDANDATLVAPTAAGTLLVQGRLGVLQSQDNGVSWTPVVIDGEGTFAVYPNLSDRNSLLAQTTSLRLFRTTDGGRTWTFTAPAVPPPNAYIHPATDLKPLGPQPGLVYGIYEACETGFTGCQWNRKDVVKSIDGGTTWVKTPSGAGDGTRLFVGPADPKLLLAGGQNGGFRSRDGGEHWEQVSTDYQFGGSLVPDPLDAARWYRVVYGGQVALSIDTGSTWVDISPPYMIATGVDLVIDATDTRRLYLVHGDGGVSASDDRGAHWRLIVSPSRFVNAVPDSARLAAGTPATLYAGAEQGALRLALGGALVPQPVRAVEYYRPQFDHYFVTASVSEMAKLDQGTPSPLTFARTGLEFNVWPAGTPPPTGASAVCRFYGLPEKGLDSHFFSAFPAECEAVKQRFAGTWLFETPDAFVAGVPDAAGKCPGTTTSVYRLFNNRTDANHRYTTSRAVRDAMVAAGWIAEGYGQDGVAMCAP